MQFNLLTAKARPSFADKAILVKPVIGVRLDLTTLQPVPKAVQEAVNARDAATERMEAILLEAGVESEEGLAEIGTDTQKEAFAVHVVAVAKMERIAFPVLKASDIALALQGVGRYAPHMTKALKRSLRGAWLLDETEEA